MSLGINNLPSTYFISLINSEVFLSVSTLNTTHAYEDCTIARPNPCICVVPCFPHSGSIGYIHKLQIWKNKENEGNPASMCTIGSWLIPSLSCNLSVWLSSMTSVQCLGRLSSKEGIWGPAHCAEVWLG